MARALTHSLNQRPKPFPTVIAADLKSATVHTVAFQQPEHTDLRHPTI